MRNNQDDDNGIAFGFTLTEESLSAYFVIFLSILGLVLILSSMLHKSRFASILPEAGLTVVIGLISGGLIYALGDSNVFDRDDDDQVEDIEQGLLSFDSRVFFDFLLPPIIFNSGYHIKKELFNLYLYPIALYACVGTAISTGIVALTLYIAVQLDVTGGFYPSVAELLTFGALISATDPVSTLAVFQQKCVDPQLFYLVFGESVLNDAVGIVLFNSLAKYVGHSNESSNKILYFLADFSFVLIGSLLIGVASGSAAACVLKNIDMKQTRLLELCSYIILIYAPFFVAEALPLSGIITSLFTGLAAKEYAEPILSKETAVSFDLFSRVISHLAETSLFLELGLSVYGIQFLGNFHWQFILFAFIGCLVGRFMNVYPITLLYNYFSRKFSIPNGPEPDTNELAGQCSEAVYVPPKINLNTAHMLWFSGLRGAVAYACAKSFPDTLGHRKAFVVTTIVIVLITIFFLGGATEWILEKLHIEMGVDENKYMQDLVLRPRNGILDRIENGCVSLFSVRNNEKRDESTNESGTESDYNDIQDLDNIPSSDYIRLVSPSTDQAAAAGMTKDSVYDYGANTW